MHNKIKKHRRYKMTQKESLTPEKALLLLKSDANCCGEETIRKALKCIDMGILLGAPLPNNTKLLTDSASYLMEKLSLTESRATTPCDDKSCESKKRKCIHEFESYCEINAKEVPMISCPSLQKFSESYFIPQHPVKLQDCMMHWPATTKWLDVNYLLKVAGNRTVPVEIGSHYVDENWSQKLMTISDFIREHYNENVESRGYLAQHNLFDQITELRNDICVPEYCSLSRNYEESTDPDINAWFGPKGTVSPLHFDPKDNLLTQVFGTKQIILFSPADSRYLYPHEDKLLCNTSQVNPTEPNLELHPEFPNATMYKCLLCPGEMLYIPPKWWHHVTALDKSFSVSFWWQ